MWEYGRGRREGSAERWDERTRGPKRAGVVAWECDELATVWPAPAKRSRVMQ